MKYIVFIGAVLMGIYSCSNEFDITEDRKDIPVVYGLINPVDTATYLRIERGFISDDQSALDIAQIPDSLYYMNLDARIIDVESGEEFTLTRVDGNEEGYVRDQGVFAVAPNYLYKLSADEFTPIEKKTYELRLDRGDNLSTVTASTIVVDNPRISRPADGFPLVFRNGFETIFEWKLSDEGKIYDLYLEVKYSESIDNAPFENKRLKWDLATSYRDQIISIEGQRFFNFLASQIEENPLAIRSFGNVDVVLVTGGQEVLDFISIGQANLGITSSQDIPTYTNLSEGVGIFSSRNVERKNSVSLTQITLDSLRMGAATRNLNFQ